MLDSGENLWADHIHKHPWFGDVYSGNGCCVHCERAQWKIQEKASGTCPNRSHHGEYVSWINTHKREK